MITVQYVILETVSGVYSLGALEILGVSMNCGGDLNRSHTCSFTTCFGIEFNTGICHYGFTSVACLGPVLCQCFTNTRAASR